MNDIDRLWNPALISNTFHDRFEIGSLLLIMSSCGGTHYPTARVYTGMKFIMVYRYIPLKVVQDFPI